MKSSILYYSDCSYFAGCENMIANFLNDQTIQENFTVSFAYNYSDKYEEGLNSRVYSCNYKKFPLRIMKQINYCKPKNSTLIWSIIHKAFFAFYIPIYKYVSILINTIILYHFFKNHRVDILHINNGGYPAANSCYSAVVAAKVAGINRILYVVNNIAEDYKHPFRWFDYPIDFFIKKWVTVFITGSEYAGNRLKKVLRLSKNKQITINNGILKRAITLTREEFKKKYSVPENKIIASVVANLEKRKGHIYLLNSIVQIKKQYKSDLIPVFILEGIGPEKSILKRFIKENQLQEHVLMIDYIPEIFNLLNISDIIILPSIENEDFPNIIIEAMSMGKPVIGTEIAGIPEQIINMETGIIIKPKNCEELKNAILFMVSNPNLVKKFSMEANKRFNTMFEKSISVKKYQELYYSLLN